MPVKFSNKNTLQIFTISSTYQNLSLLCLMSVKKVSKHQSMQDVSKDMEHTRWLFNMGRSCTWQKKLRNGGILQTVGLAQVRKAKI